MPTEARHVLLVGARGVGKTTLIDRLVRALGVAPGGFRTRFDDRLRPDRTLLLGDGRDMRPVVRFADGVPGPVLTPVFDDYGCALLSGPAGLIVLDECGRFERDAHAFQAAILRCLDGDVPVLGVVQRTDGDWPDALLRHPAVCVVEVRADNRDALFEPLMRHFAGQGGVGP